VNSAGIRPADLSEKVKGHGCHAGTEVAIMVGADKLEVVEEFRYLVSFEHKMGSMISEIASRRNGFKHGFKNGFKHASNLCYWVMQWVKTLT